jgi:hypothetical protein
LFALHGAYNRPNWLREECRVDPTETVTQFVLEYAEHEPPLPLDPALSLRRDLGIGSLALVALTLRLGDALAIDLAKAGAELHRLDTVADLIGICRGRP